MVDARSALTSADLRISLKRDVHQEAGCKSLPMFRQIKPEATMSALSWVANEESHHNSQHHSFRSDGDRNPGQRLHTRDR